MTSRQARGLIPLEGPPDLLLAAWINKPVEYSRPTHSIRQQAVEPPALQLPPFILTLIGAVWINTGAKSLTRRVWATTVSRCALLADHREAQGCWSPKLTRVFDHDFWLKAALPDISGLVTLDWP